VRGVRVLGNKAHTTREVFREVDLAATPRSFTSPGFVTNESLRDDVTRLRAWYERQGFVEADVQVHASRDDRGDVEVVFVVDEGTRYLLQRVVLAGGDPAVTADVLSVMAHCQKGRVARRGEQPARGDDCAENPLLPDELDADARRIEAVYAARGYPPVEAVVELGFDDAGQPQLRASVVPVGATDEERARPTARNVKPLRLGEIFVEGNLVTDRDVLLREMGLQDAKIGDRLDPTLIARGVSRLRRTGLFSRVDLEFLGIADHDGTAHVRVTVEERPASSLDLSLGFSTAQLFSLRVEGRQKNLFGSMFDASAAADLGLFIGRVSQLRTQVRWPRVLGSDVSLSFTPLSLSYRDDPAGIFLPLPSTPAAQKVAAAWELPDTRRRLFSTGTALSIDWRAASLHPLLDEKLTIGAALEARGDWLDVNGRYYAPLSGEAFAALDGVLNVLDVVDPALVVSVTPRIAYSNVDNPFDPASGVGAEIFVRTVPFSLAPYAVVGTQARGYLTLFDDRLTLASGLKLRWGLAGESNRCAPEDTTRCEWGLMQNDLLRPGGDRTVRGVAENTIGVPGILYDQTLTAVAQKGVLQSGVRPGVFGAVLNLEARFTLIRQLFLGALKPAVFSDIGVSTDDLAVNWRSIDDVLAEPRLAVSVGAGLRYVLPVGPLSIDVAWSPFDEGTGVDLPVRVSGALGYIF
jgi:outer membrane protein assembly factor BamA